MKSNRRSVVTVCATILFVATLATRAARSEAPRLVSPTGAAPAGCPTFSWTTVPDAAGYRLVVFSAPTDGATWPTELLTADLPAGANSWTPSAADCPPPGGSYAWSLQAVDERGDGEWSEPALFRVAAAPSEQEVVAALEVLRRYAAEHRKESAAEGGHDEALPRSAGPEHPSEAVATRPLRPEPIPRRPEPLELAPAATTLPLGTPSLTVDANVALGAASNIFKNGYPFLWDDGATGGDMGVGTATLLYNTGSGNTASGFTALEYNTTGERNTALGSEAIRRNQTGNRNTASGFQALYANDSGSDNTASGFRALTYNFGGFSNTATGASALEFNTSGNSNTANGASALYNNSEGYQNTADGVVALYANTTGVGNTASGHYSLHETTTGDHNSGFGDRALRNNTTGSRNVGVGYLAGDSAPAGASDNVFIASPGSTGDTTPTLRIGTEGTQTRAFLAGVHGVNLSGGTNEHAVCVVDGGQLGACATSSRRYKEEIRDLGDVTPKLLRLRPVSFRYKEAPQTPADPPHFGLVAEEVAELFPQLVWRGPDGRLGGVRYELLSVLLLDELQRQHERTLALADELRQRSVELEDELDALRRRLDLSTSGGEAP